MRLPEDLKKLISEQNVTAEFIQRSQQLGINTLHDMMHADLPALKRNTYFNYIWYADMLSLLKKHSLLSQFQEKQL